MKHLKMNIFLWMIQTGGQLFIVNVGLELRSLRSISEYFMDPKVASKVHVCKKIKCYYILAV